MKHKRKHSIADSIVIQPRLDDPNMVTVFFSNVEGAIGTIEKNERGYLPFSYCKPGLGLRVPRQEDAALYLAAMLQQHGEPKALRPKLVPLSGTLFG